MMSGPAPDWMAAVMRACRSLALMVSNTTSTFVCLVYSATCRRTSVSPSGMKSTHWSRWILVPWAKAGACRASRIPSSPAVAAAPTAAPRRNVRRSIETRDPGRGSTWLMGVPPQDGSEAGRRKTSSFGTA